MLQIFSLDKDNKFKRSEDSSDIIELLQNTKSTFWVDIEDLTEREIQVLANIFQFHPLAIDDCVKSNSYPKIDDFEKYLFFIFHAVSFLGPTNEFTHSEVDIFLGPNYLVTIHQGPIRAIDVQREKCERNPLQYFGKGPDVILHAMLTILADNYLPILADIDDNMEELEDLILLEPSKEVMHQIFKMRKVVLQIRRTLGPQRDTIFQLSRGVYPQIPKKSLIYYRDIYDHMYRVHEMAEMYRDLVAGIMDLYVSVITHQQSESSHQTNQVMKTLTLMATIFFPLTVITGLYGMNFEHIPELHWKYGYLWVLGLMVVVAGAMIGFFKHKRWI
ncbi:MAG: magnesium/cobalt transporter CorA [Candidatus Omnitrophica bacterium]|nr:magnesium/cobalt transporter CorA [Candidatus Omnitrophota bacterium]